MESHQICGVTLFRTCGFSSLTPVSLSLNDLRVCSDLSAAILPGGVVSSSTSPQPVPACGVASVSAAASVSPVPGCLRSGFRFFFFLFLLVLVVLPLWWFVPPFLGRFVPPFVRRDRSECLLWWVGPFPSFMGIEMSRKWLHPLHRLWTPTSACRQVASVIRECASVLSEIVLRSYQFQFQVLYPFALLSCTSII